MRFVCFIGGGEGSAGELSELEFDKFVVVSEFAAGPEAITGGSDGFEGSAGEPRGDSEDAMIGAELGAIQCDGADEIQEDGNAVQS